MSLHTRTPKGSVHRASVREVSEDGDFASLREARKVYEQERLQKKLFESAKKLEDNEARRDNSGKNYGTSISQSLPPADRIHEKVRVKLFEVVQKGSTMEVNAMLTKAEGYVPLYHNEMVDQSNGQNILHFALEHARMDVVEIIIRNHGNKELLKQVYNVGKYTRSVLHQITETNNCMLAKNVLDKFPTTSEKVDLIKNETMVEIQGQRPRVFSSFHLAAFRGFTDLVSLYLDVGIDVNSVNSKKDTALLWASRWGHIETVNCLLDRKADVNLENDKKSTALYWAVRYQKFDTVKLLLQKGKANPNQTRLLGLVAPIVIASALGNDMIVKQLIAHGANVNTVIRGGEMPLHHAAKEGHIDVVQTLLSSNSILDAEDEKGDTPLILASENGHANVVNLLIEKGANMCHKNHFGVDTWHCAMSQDDDEVLKTLTDHYSSLRTSHKNTGLKPPLCIAASLGKCTKLQTLLNLKVDPEDRDEEGNTFIHYAAVNNQSKVICQFHKLVDINAQNKESKTALHMACEKGNRDAIMELIEKKAKSNIGNSKGENALHVVAYSRATTQEIASALVEHTIKSHDWESLNAVDDEGNNALHVAGKFASPAVLWEFRFVRFKDIDKEGNTPLHEAVISGKEEVLQTALDIYENMQRDADINTQNNSSESVLHLAAAAGFSDSVTRLIFFGADLTCTDSDGNTVLHRLVRSLAEDEDKIGIYMQVLECILHASVRWWCNVQKRLYPEEKTLVFKQMQREALLNLINNYKNNTNLSVLAYAYSLGSYEFLNRFLMMPDVMVFQRESEICFDVTHMTPSTHKYFAGSGAQTNDTGNSHIELLMSLKAKERASRVLDIPPIRQTERMYTAICAWAYTFFMVLHIIYMGIFSYLGVTISTRFGSMTNGTAKPDTDSVFIASYILVPIEPAIGLTYTILLLYRCIYRRQKPPLRSLVVCMTLIVFVCLVVTWMVMVANRDTNQDYVLAICLCLGWLMSIILTRGFKGIHYFFKMLVNMIIRDVLRFLIVFSFVLLAFGFALHVVFQISPLLVDNYSNPAETLFMTFNLMIGMAELFDDTFETGMADVGRTTTFAKFIYLVYILLSTIVLLNLLIAMMNDSYSDILLHQKVTWRLESIQIGLDVEHLLPWFPGVFGKIIIRKEKFDSGGKNKDKTRWYLVTTDEELKRYAPEKRSDETAGEKSSIFDERLQAIEHRVQSIERQSDESIHKLNELIELVRNSSEEDNSGM